MNIYNEVMYLLAKNILLNLKEKGELSQDEFEAADKFNANVFHIQAVSI